MADRPVECSQCKKPAQIHYSEMVKNACTKTDMCKDCPVLLKKLHGERPEQSDLTLASKAGLCCSHCMTTFESVQMGNPLGCYECYNVFGDLLIGELLSENKIPPRLRKGMSLRRGQPIHIGKTSESQKEVPSSSKSAALNEALNEALRAENYEEAAYLRDQIKEMEEGQSE